MRGITQSLHITARTYAYDLDDKNGNHPSQQKGKSNRLIESCIMGYIYIYHYTICLYDMKNLWCFWGKPTSWIELLNRWHPPNHSPNFGLEAFGSAEMGQMHGVSHPFGGGKIMETHWPKSLWWIEFCIFHVKFHLNDFEENTRMYGQWAANESCLV